MIVFPKSLAMNHRRVLNTLISTSIFNAPDVIHRLTWFFTNIRMKRWFTEEIVNSSSQSDEKLVISFAQYSRSHRTHAVLTLDQI